MAHKDAVFEPNDPGVVSPVTDPDDGGVAATDPDFDGPEIDAGGPALADGHDEIVEEAPGVDSTTDMKAPIGDAGDPSGFDRSALLPDDLDLSDDSALGNLSNQGGEFGSTLLDDLAGDLSDPTDGIGSMGSDGGGIPDFDDQGGRAMDGGDEERESQDGPFYGGNDGEPETGQIDPAGVYGNPEDDRAETQDDPVGSDEEDEGSSQVDPLAHHGGSDDDDDDDERKGQGDDPHETQTMPAPDDGTGGDPEAGDFIGGGRGDVDPPPETEDHGGGKLIGGSGDVDPASEADDAGGAGALDMERLGGGVIDPLNGEASLLGDDTGDLEEMAADVDLDDAEIEFDDSLADADIGDDI